MRASRRDRQVRVIGAALAGMVVAALIAVLYALVGASNQQPASTPGHESYGTAPTYTLTDQHGRSFSSAALRGRIQVVSFLFPYCTTYCPLTARTLLDTAQLADRAGLRDSITFVAFNVDPEGAGPAELSAFLRQEAIDPGDPRWHYLTGRPDEIHRIVTGGFHVFYQKVSVAEERGEGSQPTQPNALADRAHVDYDIVHNDVIEIVDAQGIIRAIFADGSGATPREILAAVDNALR